MKVTSTYLGHVFDSPVNYSRRIQRAAQMVESIDKACRIDTLAFRGMSGAAIAFPLSALTGLHLSLIRRRGEDSHHQTGSHRGLLEGYCAPRARYLIVDDFVASGSTVTEIRRVMTAEVPQSECVGLLLCADMTGLNWDSRTHGASDLPTWHVDASLRQWPEEDDEAGLRRQQERILPMMRGATIASTSEEEAAAWEAASADAFSKECESLQTIMASMIRTADIVDLEKLDTFSDGPVTPPNPFV